METKMLPVTAGGGHAEEKITREVPTDKGELKASFHGSHISRIKAGFEKSGSGTEGVSKLIHFCVSAGSNFLGFLAQNLL